MVSSNKKEEAFVGVSQLNVLVAEVEQKTGRNIEQKEISQDTNLRPATISRWMSVDPFIKADLNVAGILCEWASNKLKRDISYGDMLKRQKKLNES